MGLAVGLGVGVGVVVAEGVGLADVLVLGLLDGEPDPFEDDEHPARARLTPTVSTAAVRTIALLGFTILGYRAVARRATLATPWRQIDTGW